MKSETPKHCSSTNELTENSEIFMQKPNVMKNYKNNFQIKSRNSLKTVLVEKRMSLQES